MELSAHCQLTVNFIELGIKKQTRQFHFTKSVLSYIFF